jgi:hypothetical protein
MIERMSEELIALEPQLEHKALVTHRPFISLNKFYSKLSLLVSLGWQLAMIATKH